MDFKIPIYFKFHIEYFLDNYPILSYDVTLQSHQLCLNIGRQSYSSNFNVSIILMLCLWFFNSDKLEVKLLSIPVCTWSPFCRSDIATDLPFSSLTFAMDGKQAPTL